MAGTKKTQARTPTRKATAGTSTGAAPGELPRRRWLGWDQPILQSAVQQLLADYAVGEVWDMRELMIVLPGGLARRRLNELLALKAEAEGKLLYPPQIVTAGTLPENLYVAKLTFASDLVQHLAWLKALQGMPTAELTQLVPVPPPKSATVPWLELAKIFSGVHRELASDGLSIQQVAAALGKHPEGVRWKVLAKLQAGYLATLDQQQLWDIQTARLCALEFREPSTRHKTIVIGCVDLNRTQRGFLEQIASRVEIWLAAPESADTLFDEYGGLHSAAWQDFELDIPNQALLVGNAPADQAELVCASLAELGDRFHARDITLGVPDAKLIGELKHQLDQAGLTARYGPGVPLAQSEPILLLSLVGEYVDTKSFAAFAALLRHPMMESMFANAKVALPEDWLAQIDAYYQAALPKQVDRFVNESVRGAEVYRTVAAAVERWLNKLSSRSRPISQWVQPILNVLGEAYAKQVVDLEDPIEGPLYSAAAQVCEAVLTLRDTPSALEPSLPVTELVDWLVRSVAGRLVPEPANDAAVEMLGWLELALDDAPVLILSGIHDGVVPESVNSDAFLPNALRRQLGMVDNLQRYARDIYSMQVMLKSRQHVRIIVGKTDANGDPLVPSRLLMACGLADLPDRVLHLVKPEEVDVLPTVSKRWKRRGGASRLAIPRPMAGRVPRAMTVTAFRDYLASPYRFYLTHVLKLRDAQDADSELDAPMFGNLIHDTLQLLGESSIARCQDSAEIEAFLISRLHEIAAARFGPNPPAAVLIQIEQAEQRLQAFAPKQAERAAEGWEIRFTERGIAFEDQVLLGLEQKLNLIGRIDRIDYHPATDRWAIWDYKTSDNAKHPVSVHWSKKDGWKDLQLPLYRHVARKLGVGDNPSLGYIALPKQSSDTGFHLADFSAEQLQQADAVANQVAARVLAGEFWSDQLEVPKYDDFARICQSNVQHVSVDPPQRKLSRHQTSSATLTPQTLAEAKRLLQLNDGLQPPLAPVLIRASAGTGKTFQLTNRLLQIILSGQEVDPILASTFTRKAAGEIMHRVLQRLAQGCLDEAARIEMAGHLEGVDTSAAACLAALRRVTRSIHRLRIGTLDSFFAQVARNFSLEMGLPPGWTALDPVLEPQLQMQAIGQMLDNHERKTLVELVRMLAKGDSGRQISDQIRQTVANGHNAYRATAADDWDQLPLPTPPSEQAVESALLTLERTELKNKSGSTNKSAKDNLQKLHQHALVGNWEAVVNHGVYANLNAAEPSYFRSELDGSLIEALRLLADRAAAELLPIRRNQTLASYQVLQAYDAQYAALIRRRRALAFSDVSYYLSRWMAQSPAGLNDSVAAAQLAFRLDCGVLHLLLDEFQDTAPEQWQILQPLATPLGGPARAESSFFCVGDTKQAIYGWRGGVAEIFESVGRSVEQLQQSQMSESFRSSPEVMRAVNLVFQNLTQHENFSGCENVAQRWSQDFPEHRTQRSDLTGYVRLQNGPKVDSGTPIEERKEIFLRFSAQQIAELTTQSSASIGVLLRTNADVGRMISLLRDLGVSASQDGGNPLTDSVAVELLLSLIHLADHPGDGMCAYHIGTSPLAERLPYRSDTQPQQLAHWFRREVTRKGLGRAVEQVADRIASELSWWDQHRLEQLVRAAYDYQPAYRGRLRDFEDAVLRGRVALPTDAQVKVMTVHKSKGLEFDAVFLPELDIDLSSSNALFVLRGADPCQPPDGVLRYMNSSLQAMLPENWQRAFDLQKQRGVSESLCLLYVAMTRARRALMMITRPTSNSALQEIGSVLQSTLGQGLARNEPEAVLYQDGNPQWFEAMKQTKAEVSETSQPVVADEIKLTLRTDMDSAPLRGLRVAAPSNMHARREHVPLALAFSASHSTAAAHGALMHALFEQVRWLEDFRVDLDQLRRVVMSKLDPEALQHISVDRLLKEFVDYLDSASVRAALSQSRYQQPVFGSIPTSVELENERVISLVSGKQLITGTIDRLAILNKDGRPYAAEIFDFKTDQFDANEGLIWHNERLELHRPQLDIYAQVIAQLFELPRKRIATYLVMLSSNQLLRCETQDL